MEHRRGDHFGPGSGQGLLPCGLQLARRPMDLTAQAGLILVAETLMALDLEAIVQTELHVRRRRRGLAEFDKVQAIVLLLAAGGASRTCVCYGPMRRWADC